MVKPIVKLVLKISATMQEKLSENVTVSFFCMTSLKAENELR